MSRNQISNAFAFSPFTLSKALRKFLVALFAAGCLAVIVWPSAFRAAGAKHSILPVERVAMAQTSEPVLSAGGAPVTFGGGPFAVPNPTDQVDGVPTCNAALPCSDFVMNVDVPAGYDDHQYVKVQVNWTNPAAQFDLFVYTLNGDGSLGKLQAANFFAVNPDVIAISAISGKYLLRVSPTIPLGDSYTGSATLEPKVAPAVQGGISTPTFQNFQSPSGLGNGSGEPSIGVALPSAQNPQGRAMYQSGTQMLRVTFNDAASPAEALWESKSAPNAPGSLDPILFTDRQTGRTFTSQLAGPCSKAAYTDTASPFNDGDTWVPSQGCGFPAGVDHQTMGGGPLHAPLTTGAAYPNGVYYCSQYGTQAAACALSLDGGLTFGPAIPIYTVSCFGIHGHVKVAPDGTVYVPDSDCSSAGAQTIGNFPTATARQALVFSEDNGITWSQPQLVPDSNPAPGIVDPSIGIGAQGTIYYGYANSNGAPSVAVGHLDQTNHKIVWSPSQDVGTPFGIKNLTFPSMVAGDDDRAAFAFMGTPTGGYYQDYTNFSTNTGFPGVWHLYVAYTYDSGNTWKTVDVTPNDPVQRGSICNSGTVICSRIPDDRNLLDFIDATVDHQGRVLVAYPDGCITQACIQGGANDYTAKATIARQSGGKGLFGAFDNGAPTPTPTPTPTATPTPNACSSSHSGTVSLSNANLGYCGGPFAAPNPSSPAGNTPPACASGTCDQFALTVSLPPGVQTLYAVTVSIGWPAGNGDFDLYVYQPDEVTGSMVSKGDGSTNPEVARFQATTGNYTIYVVPFDNGTNATFTGTIKLTPLFDSGAAPTATPAPRIIPIANQDTGPKIGFENFTAPGVLTPTLVTSAGQQPNSVEYMGRGAGEPSIGNNWKSGVTSYQSDLQTLFVTFNDSCPANGQTSSWVNRQAPTSLAVNSDPIGFTDPQTGRTFAGELTLLSPSCKTSFSDDDGKTWIPTQGSGIASGVDHQTIGGGPFAAPLTRPTNVPGVYPNAVYYCSQEGVPNSGPPSFCSRSDDGGLTFGPSVPLTTPPLNVCGGLHGHVKVSPKDGAAYVPFNQCDGEGSVIVSLDNGITWTIRHVETSSTRTTPSVSFQDPAVAVDSNGRVYYIIANNDTAAAVLTSDDHGATWQNLGDVGAVYGLQNIRYPAAIAGDAGRAAVAFYGTTTPGDAVLPTFDGEWHLYIANTFDGGQTWTTTDATPNAPLQRGCIWAKGGANICRNLLDFFDMTVDREGRVLVGYVNGCEGGNCAQAAAGAKGNAYTAAATIARQSSGRRLIAAYDPQSSTSKPGIPSVTTRRVGNVVHLGWSEADNGNSAITTYKILRSTASGAETLLTTVTGSQTRFDDTSATDTSKTYYYKVLAVNSAGVSCAANEVAAPYVGDTCSGVIVHQNDPKHPEANAGTNTPASLLIDSVAVGEPPATGNLMFKLKVNSLASIPANSRWRVVWNSFSAEAFDSIAQQYYVGMTTGPDGVPKFEYGTLADAGVPAVFVISETKRGDALAGSNYNADGTITLYVPKWAVGYPAPGDLLGAVNGRTLTGDIPGSADSKLERSNLFADHTFVKAQTDNSYPAATYMVMGNPSSCAAIIEDDDARIAYGNGWHLVQNSGASDGHFRVQAGKGNAVLSFNVNAGSTGKLTYLYATSKNGGSAEILLDGVSQGSVNYSGSTGTLNSPVFGANISYGGMRAGSHTLEVRPTKGAVYVDGFRLENANSQAQPASGPGQTMSGTNALSAGQHLLQNLTVGSSTKAISVLAATDTPVPLKLVLISPSGAILGAVDATSGVAVIDLPVTAQGTYIIKVVNVSLGPVQVWTAATPLVTR